VSAKGRSRSACTVKAPCKTIGRAVKLAVAGDTVSVAHGTYREQVTIAKDITVTGAGMPMVDATGHVNGFLITGAGAAGAKVSGFMVEKANDEGILAMRTSDVTIAHNTMQGNDLGLKAKKLVGECAPQGQVPGDCGEALHLMSVTHSNVVSNTVQNNAGGILLTDELGPTAQNLISNNKSLNNVLDCGITLAGHNTNAVSSTGAPKPAVAGIYDNVVSGNTANGDGLGGVTLHSHAPGQDLNGNVIVGNSLSGDGIAGNPGGTPGDVDYGITHTVGIIIASSVTPLQGTAVAGNTVSNDYYGIWTKNVPTISASANTFNGVTTPLSQN
jgi:nitrous oxidase accessory protein NosD